MRKHRVILVAALASVAAIEGYGLIHPNEGYTISELTRVVFHTKTRTGRVVFNTALAGFVGWFGHHITDPAHQ